MLLWASAFVVIRDQGSVFSPGAMAVLRLVFGLLVLTPLWLVTRRRGGTPRPSRRALLFIALYGAAWFGGYTVALNWAELHLDAGTAALLVNVAPLLVAAFAGLFLGEGFSRPVLTGMAIGFAGVVVITAGGTGAEADVVGIVLGLLTAVLYAAGVLLQKVALHTVDAVTTTWLGAVAGLVVTLPFVPTAVQELGDAAPSDIALIAYLGIGPTAIAFTTWAYALARTSASTMAATTLVVPAIVIVLSWLFLGEVPTPLRVVGGALCLLGVAVSRGLVRLSR